MRRQRTSPDARNVTFDPDWAKTSPWNIAKIGSAGTVVIQNTDNSKTIDPDADPFAVDIQLLCPGRNIAQETLHHLTGHEGTCGDTRGGHEGAGRQGRGDHAPRTVRSSDDARR